MATLPPPTFDLESYANNYTGPILPLRLAHIAVNCESLRKQSLSLALVHAKTGRDTQLYRLLTDLADSFNLPGLAAVDVGWASAKDEENRRELARLESELRGYKNNLIRESIRMGQEDLATHLMRTGGPLPDPTNTQSSSLVGYNSAYQAFARMRDYCTTPSHINAMMLRLAYTALLSAVSTQLSSGAASMHLHNTLVNANRLRNTGVKEEEQLKLTPISCVMTGIAHIGLGDYRAAASAFLSTPFEYNSLGPVYGEDCEKTVANANDVAIYGGLCALATLSREELVETVLGGSFRSFLELEPHMRKAISLYTTAKYQACIDTLRRYYSDWRLDIYLGAAPSSTTGTHVDRLFAQIRERSITAYFSSFSEVSLSSLASTFPSESDSPSAVEAEVGGMIERGTLQARLDVVNGILIAPQRELRAATHQDAQKAAEEVERTLLLRLHTVNMTLAGLEIPRIKAGQWGEVRNGY